MTSIKPGPARLRWTSTGRPIQLLCANDADATPLASSETEDVGIVSVTSQVTGRVGIKTEQGYTVAEVLAGRVPPVGTVLRGVLSTLGVVLVRCVEGDQSEMFVSIVGAEESLLRRLVRE